MSAAASNDTPVDQLSKLLRAASTKQHEQHEQLIDDCLHQMPCNNGPEYSAMAALDPYDNNSPQYRQYDNIIFNRDGNLLCSDEEQMLRVSCKDW